MDKPERTGTAPDSVVSLKLWAEFATNSGTASAELTSRLARIGSCATRTRAWHEMRAFMGREPTPDAERFIASDSVRQTLRRDRTLRADGFGSVLGVVSGHAT